MYYAIGIDIGGTAIKIGLVSEKGDVFSFKSFTTPTTKKGFISIICKNISTILLEKDIDVRGIGIGIPGMMNLRTNNMLFLPHIPYLLKTNIVSILRKRFSLPCFADNDAHVALNGILHFSSNANYKTAIMLTLGTGTGSAIAVRGKLYSGVNYSVAGLGEQIIKFDGRTCSCGRKGCLNAYTGKHAIQRFAQEILGKRIDPELVYMLCKGGDKKALEVYERVGFFLGLGFANIVSVFGPDRIILTGNMAKAWPYMKNRALETLKKNLFGGVKPKVKINISPFQEATGVVGAASLVFDKLISISRSN